MDLIKHLRILAAVAVCPASICTSGWVLMFHGLEDPYLLHPALCGNWEWIEKDLTLVTVPGHRTSFTMMHRSSSAKR